MKAFKLTLFYFIFLFLNVSFAQSLSSEEQKLYDIIMEYRKVNNLPEIPLSKSLNTVAKTHVRDLMENNPNQGICNMHSWSDKGNWTPCCYTSDHKRANCVWNKPRELTSYPSKAYEIAFWSSSNITAINALKGWKKSKGHNAVIINQDNWHDNDWKAIGIGILDNYVVVWFGGVEDQN